ncbi:MAG: nicotinate-nucleotide--dimethylbenzimidazole phosphoribosyltransferase [Hyphomicrobium sp.]
MTADRDATVWREALRLQLLARIRGKAKPVGALGRLETLALQIGLASGSLVPDLKAAKVMVFAGDHGLTAEGVTAYPSAVTREIAKLVLAGGAGISICARAAGVDVMLVDAGLLRPLAPHALLLDRRIGAGTKNSRREPAMTAEQCRAALIEGRAIDTSLGHDGVGIVAFGEIGIGNSSAAALVAHTLTGLSLDVLVGPGAGAPPLGVDHKRQVLSETVACAPINESNLKDRAFETLRQFAGFEMVMMAGAMTAAAMAGRLIIVDGFISTAVAIAAAGLRPETLDHCVFSHCSSEPGHRALLAYLRVEPLLDLGMRLGEGTGAALALPLIRAAEMLLRDMADLPGEHPL